MLPVKEKKLQVKERWLNYIVVKWKDQVFIHQRTAKDIWQQLFEFVLIETEKKFSTKKILTVFDEQYGFKNYTVNHSYSFRQKLTHQFIHFCFIEIEVTKKQYIADFSWIKISELHRYAFPKTLQEFVAAHL